jgi:hypothetical protein
MATINDLFNKLPASKKKEILAWMAGHPAEVISAFRNPEKFIKRFT